MVMFITSEPDLEMPTKDLRPGKGLTAHGTLHFISRKDPGKSGKPIVVMTHGALRRAEHLMDWFPVLSDDYDVIICDLPGHGRDDGTDIKSLTDYVKRVYATIAHFELPCVVIGESLGGLVALRLAAIKSDLIRGVIAADPPLSTAKQWSMRLNLNNHPLNQCQTDIFASVLGIRGDEDLGERLYFGLVKAAHCPTTILTGTKSLFPRRSALPEADNVPCLLDPVDLAFIDEIANQQVSVVRVQGAGHLCLHPKFQDAVSLVTSFCRDHLK